MARRPIMRGRVRRHRSDAGPQNDQEGLFVEIEPGVRGAEVAARPRCITSEASSLQGNLQGAVDKIQSGLQDAGVSADKAQSSADDASATVSSAFHALIHGLETGISALAPVAVFVSFTALSLFFLLKDGPTIREWTERHMGLPPSVATMVTRRTLQRCGATSSA